MRTENSAYLDTPLWNSALSVKERVQWLLSEMTLDEKLTFLATRGPALPRLGIEPFSIGGEAAHGIEARHDQDGGGAAEAATSFPQPIGMSASWDTQLIEEAGRIIGTECRVLWHRHKNGGLSRWAPTVDMERDPRWGRTEEAYGEDPLLTGKMASAYVRGLQGTDGNYLRMAASLKHFYANNVEEGRIWKSSSIDPRNKYEYYLEPFRRVTEEGHVEAMMTAYNEINGIPAILNPEVQRLVKDQWGLRGHVVCDGGDMSQTVEFHHYCGTHAQTVAQGLKAGVDCFTDDAALVEESVREAFALGLIQEADIDRALANTFGTKIRLGIYDADLRNPYDRVTQEDINTAQADELSLRMAQEGCVLLKNDSAFLPLKEEEKTVLIGPLADVWYHDWYGGEPPCKVTLREGLESLLGREIPCETGLPEIRLRCGGKYVALDTNNRLHLSENKEDAETFIRNDWGFGSETLWAKSAQRFVTLEDGGALYASKEEAFGWFVKESFCIEEMEDGQITLCGWDARKIGLDGNDRLSAASKGNETPEEADTGAGEAVKLSDVRAAAFLAETVRDGFAEAKKAARAADQVILALGCNPVINSKEEVDRTDLILPPFQEELARRIVQANPNVVLVLLTNYPYAVNWEQEHIPAILQSATGGQQMGRAVADVLYGKANPAGRLPMTWYKGVSDLPDIDDYDIQKGGRTYRYFEGEPLYPFGYGLSYTTFSYGGFSVRIEDHTALRIAFTVTNTGERTGDEVAQVYFKAPRGRVHRPVKQLAGFCRVKGLRPGECREVSLCIPISELRYYDVISRSLIVEEGEYDFFAGGSSDDEAVKTKVWVDGMKPGARNPGEWTEADHYDDYENIYLYRAYAGLTCAVVKEPSQEGRLVYRDFDLAKAGGRLVINLQCAQSGSVKVLINGRTALHREVGRTLHYIDVPFNVALTDEEKTGRAEVELLVTGDVRISRFRFKAE